MTVTDEMVERRPCCGTPLAELAATNLYSDEMVERAAKAICNHGRFHDHNAWLYADKVTRDHMREVARAVLEVALSGKEEK